MKLARIVCTLLFVAVLGFGVDARSLRGGATSGQTVWRQVLLGAGGQSTELQMQICAPGYALERGDTATPHYRVPGSVIWEPLYTPSRKGDLISGNLGAWAIACSKTDPTTIWVNSQGWMLRSQSNGPFHRITAIPQLLGYNNGASSCNIASSDSNGACKWTRQKIAVDPANPNVVYFETNNNGVMRSFNADATDYTAITAATVSGITGGTIAGGGAGIAFNPASGTVPCPSPAPAGELCTAEIFVPTMAVGVWHTTDGGGTWTNLVSDVVPPIVRTYTTSLANSYIIADIQTSSDTVTGVSDNIGLTWIKRAGPISESGGVFSSYEYYALAPSAGAYTITFTFSNGGTNNRVGLWAINGANTSTPFDPNLSSACTSTTAAPACTTTNANDLVVAFVHGFPTSVDSGYTVLNSLAPTSGFFSEYQIVSIPQIAIQPQGIGSVATSGITDAFQQAIGGTLAIDGTPSIVNVPVTPSGPLSVYSGRIAPDGAYWATNQALTYKWVSGTWTSYSLNGSCGGSGYINAAVPNPNVVGAVVFFQGAGCFSETVTNNGTLLTDSFGCNVWLHQNSICSGDGEIIVGTSNIGWLSGSIGLGGFGGDADFDPISGQYCIGNGVGVFCGTIPTTLATCGANYCLPTVTINTVTSQIENLVGQDIIAPQGGAPLLGNDDRPVFQQAGINVYPSAYGPINGGFNYTHQIDYASSDPSWVCVMAWFGFPASPNQQTACSNSYGAPGTWTLFSGAIPGIINGGAIAVVDHNNTIVNNGAGASGALACNTGGLTGAWVAANSGSGECGGLPTTGWNTGWDVCADRINIGVVYAFYFTSSSSVQWYRTPNLSSPFTEVYNASPVGGNVGGRQRVRCVPYSTGGTYGDLWLAPALAQFSPGSNFVSKSTDGGVSWEAISRANGSNIDLTSPVDIGYGKPETVGGYSTMWAYAYGNNGSGALLGFWRSTDGGVTWIELNPSYPNTLDYVQSINGDMNNPYMVYANTGSSGSFSGQYIP